MGIAIVIISGLVVMTVVAAGFDFLAKKNKSNSNVSINQLRELEDRIKILENNEIERTEQILKLQDEVKFVNKLLEDKSRS
jgi:uncharacterized small protein (DUF1192 family)